MLDGQCHLRILLIGIRSTSLPGSSSGKRTKLMQAQGFTQQKSQVAGIILWSLLADRQVLAATRRAMSQPLLRLSTQVLTISKVASLAMRACF
jgi:hypothetical protein